MGLVGIKEQWLKSKVLLSYRAGTLLALLTIIWFLVAYSIFQTKVNQQSELLYEKVINQAELSLVSLLADAKAVLDESEMLMKYKKIIAPDKQVSMLKHLFVERLGQTSGLMQARLLDASGMERLKVVNTNTYPVAIDKSKLINKSHRDYHQNALTLKLNQYRLSKLEPNKEYGKVVKPVQYTTRLSKGLFLNEQMEFYVLVNLDFNHYMFELARSMPEGVSVYIKTDNFGWIYTPSVSAFEGSESFTQQPQKIQVFDQAPFPMIGAVGVELNLEEKNKYIYSYQLFNKKFFEKKFSDILMIDTQAQLFVKLDQDFLISEALGDRDFKQFLLILAFGWLMGAVPILILRRHDKLSLVSSVVSDRSNSITEQCLNNSQMNSLFNATDNGSIFVDQSGQILLINQRARELADVDAGADLKSMRDDEGLKILWFRLLSSEGEKAALELRGKDLLVSYKEVLLPESVYYMINLSDNSLQKYFENILQEHLLLDQSTLLPNKVALEQAIKADLDTDRPFTLCLVNLQGMSLIADALGHNKADSGLLALADKIKKCLDDNGELYRIAGYEVALKLNFNDRKEIKDLFLKLHQICLKPINIDGQAFFVSLQAGVSFYPEDSESRSGLIRQAYLALQSAKTRRDQSLCFFEQSMEMQTRRKIQLEVDVRRALASEEFVVYLQPKISMKENAEVSGFEALSRWRHPQRGILLPEEFIDQVETGPMAVRFGYLALKNSARAAKAINEEFNTNYRIAVNFSTYQLFDSELLIKTINILEKEACPSSWLGIEVTETSMMHDTDAAVKVLASLVDMGFEVAIDDFGTGYSSLSYLKKLPVQTLKVDRTFIRNIVRDKDDFSIVQASVSMAHAIGMKIIAEGVEDQSTHQMLVDLGIDEGQGYLYSRPCSLKSSMAWLRSLPGSGVDAYQSKVIGLHSMSRH
jgi:EAL domain-containing protein (putative c-di-GMP-specific phosphodiesterase class I)/GGDEF domain-containing protein